MKTIEREIVSGLIFSKDGKLLVGERVLCNMKFNVYRIDLDTNAEETLLNPSDDLPTLEWADTSKLNEYKLTPPSISLFERIGLA